MTKKYHWSERQPDGTWKKVYSDKPMELPAFVTLAGARVKKPEPCLLFRPLIRLRQWWQNRRERIRANNILNTTGPEEYQDTEDSIFDRIEFFCGDGGIPKLISHDDPCNRTPETKLSRAVLNDYINGKF